MAGCFQSFWGPFGSVKVRGHRNVRKQLQTVLDTIASACLVQPHKPCLLCGLQAVMPSELGVGSGLLPTLPEALFWTS